MTFEQFKSFCTRNGFTTKSIFNNNWHRENQNQRIEFLFWKDIPRVDIKEEITDDFGRKFVYHSYAKTIKELSFELNKANKTNFKKDTSL